MLHLDGLCKGGKANLEVLKVKYIVVVGHEANSQDPGLSICILIDAASASVRAWKVWTKVEGLCYGEGLAIKVEGNIRNNGVTRESVVSIILRLRTRDQGIECSNIRGNTNDNGSSL